jgi:hypothetical protein
MRDIISALNPKLKIVSVKFKMGSRCNCEHSLLLNNDIYIYIYDLMVLCHYIYDLYVFYVTTTNIEDEDVTRPLQKIKYR